jgi:hypothetical protein
VSVRHTLAKAEPLRVFQKRRRRGALQDTCTGSNGFGQGSTPTSSGRRIVRPARSPYRNSRAFVYHLASARATVRPLGPGKRTRIFVPAGRSMNPITTRRLRMVIVVTTRARISTKVRVLINRNASRRSGSCIRQNRTRFDRGSCGRWKVQVNLFLKKRIGSSSHG